MKTQNIKKKTKTQQEQKELADLLAVQKEDQKQTVTQKFSQKL